MKTGYQGLTKSETRAFVKDIKYKEQLRDALDGAEINPLYHKLAQIAFDTVLRTMLENESSHGDEWLHKPVDYHKRHAMEHAELSYAGEGKEDDNGHCLTRCAMVEYLEVEHDV